MKTIVSIQEISELDIKPQSEIAEWRKLVSEEIAVRWADRKTWVWVSCPCCGRDDNPFAFDSYDVSYRECKDCGTLYAPERPSEKDIWDWYHHSAPAKYWRDKLLLQSETARREKIIYPRATWIMDSIAEYRPSATHLVDVSHNGRALIEAIAEDNARLTNIVAAGLTAGFEGDSVGTIKVSPTPIAELGGFSGIDIITAIDIFDRCADLKLMISGFNRMLARGGLLFATTIVASGFEIQALWDKSPSIIPPDKLNLPTVEGLKKMFDPRDWEILELSTPGMFDIDVVISTMDHHPEHEWPRPLRALLRQRSASSRRAIVELLQSLSMASFARIIVRKRDTKIY